MPTIEIIPNWHPIFVHFTVALYTIAVAFFILAWLFTRVKISTEFLITARWCLWAGAVFGIVTVIFGFIAFNTVAHDDPAHRVMIDHRNWALATLLGVAIMAVWSWVTRRRHRPSILFLLGLIIVFVLLTTTAWHGGELVYRHGLGVMSLPQPAAHQQGGHDHDHGNSHEHSH